jgi:uncharacterized Tic20 family protein
MSSEPSVSTIPSQDERVMAALSHISVVLPFMGVIAPIVIWATQKNKSPFVAFQSLQAIAFQLTMILSWFLGMGCYMCSFFGMFAIMAVASAASRGRETFMSPYMEIPFFFPFVIFAAMFAVMIIFDVYGVVAAIRSLQGKPFRYAVIGQRVERFLNSNQD